jgi:hypothetical protein
MLQQLRGVLRQLRRLLRRMFLVRRDDRAGLLVMCRRHDYDRA